MFYFECYFKSRNRALCFEDKIMIKTPKLFILIIHNNMYVYKKYDNITYILFYVKILHKLVIILLLLLQWNSQCCTMQLYSIDLSIVLFVLQIVLEK